MYKKELEDKIIQNYQSDEKMMILVFAQWCVNHDLDPVKLYLRAYPDQASNQHLKEAIELTVSKDEAGEVSDQSLLGVLSLYGNDDLAFIVTEEINKMRKPNKL
jgi:type III secretory pathway component EscR